MSVSCRLSSTCLKPETLCCWLQVLNQTEDHRQRVLQAASKTMRVWFIKVRKMKAIYHTLNLCNIDVTHKCLIAEVWCPVSDLDSIQFALRRGTVGCSPLFWVFLLLLLIVIHAKLGKKLWRVQGHNDQSINQMWLTVFCLSCVKWKQIHSFLLVFFSPRRGAAPRCRPSSIGCRRSKLHLLLTRPTSSPLASRTSLTPTASGTTEKSIQVIYMYTYFNTASLFDCISASNTLYAHTYLCWLFFGLSKMGKKHDLFLEQQDSIKRELSWLQSPTPPCVPCCSSIHHHHFPLPVCGDVWWHGSRPADDLCCPLPGDPGESPPRPKEWQRGTVTPSRAVVIHVIITLKTWEVPG